MSKQCNWLLNVLTHHAAPIIYRVKPAGTGTHYNAKVWRWCDRYIGRGFDLSQPPFQFLAKTPTHASTKAHFLPSPSSHALSATLQLTGCLPNCRVFEVIPLLPPTLVPCGSEWTCLWYFPSAALSTHKLTLMTLVCMRVYTTLIPHQGLWR